MPSGIELFLHILFLRPACHVWCCSGDIKYELGAVEMSNMYEANLACVVLQRRHHQHEFGAVATLNVNNANLACVMLQ